MATATATKARPKKKAGKKASRPKIKTVRDNSPDKPDDGPRPIPSASNGNGHVHARPFDLNIPVEFGGVSIGDATARLGLRIDKSVLNVVAADECFCGHRLSGRVVLGSGGDSPGQTTFVEEESVSGTFDVKSIGVNGKQISTGLTFSLSDVDIAALAGFSKGSGRLIVDAIAELPKEVSGDDDGDGLGEDGRELPGMLKAEGPWAEVQLENLFEGNLLKCLKKAGLATVGNLADYTAKDKRLTDIEGIGPAASEKIENRMLQFFADNPDAGQKE